MADADNNVADKDAPGVWVEEASFRAPAIEGVNTSTCGFVGPAHEGPVGEASEPLASYAEFERVYGGADDFPFGRCYLAHAVRTFFREGGTRLYVARVGGWEGDAAPTAEGYADALRALEAVDDISVVAAPGYSTYADSYQDIEAALLAHVDGPERSGHRVAVLDPPPDQTPDAMHAVRDRLDSTRAALYYPWIMTWNPAWRKGRADVPRQIALPPSGFVCGVYARSDAERGVHKPPANQPVRSAVRLQIRLNTAQQDTLSRAGVNCLRVMPGRGCRIWGARTVSSDSDWLYVHVRRTVHYFQASIERGTQWAAFEPNDEALWANVAASVSAFLLKEWRSGVLVGQKPEEAFFVRCDRSTMTQKDIDAGRLVCLIGVAPARPAEFVIFRIGQWTADRTD